MLKRRKTKASSHPNHLLFLIKTRKSKWEIIAILSFVSFKFGFFLFCFKFLMYDVLPCFLHFLSSFTKLGEKTDSFNNSVKLTHFCLVKIHSTTYIILETCFFPLIPMVISVSSALMNTISTRKKKSDSYLVLMSATFLYI